MFLEIVKDVRTGHHMSHQLVTKLEMLKKHPHCMDLAGWAEGGRVDSRFGLSNVQARFLYVKTNTTNESDLETMARSL